MLRNSGVNKVSSGSQKSGNNVIWDIFNNKCVVYNY